MFADLGTEDGDGYFYNSMKDYNGHSQTLQNTQGSTVDATNGLRIQNGETQSILNVNNKFHLNFRWK